MPQRVVEIWSLKDGPIKPPKAMDDEESMWILLLWKAVDEGYYFGPIPQIDPETQSANWKHLRPTVETLDRLQNL